MKIKLVILSFVVCTTSFAETIKSKIYEVVEGRPGEEHIVKMEDGHVVFVKDSSYLSGLRHGQEMQDVVQIEINSNRELTSIQTIESGSGPVKDEAMTSEAPLSFEPSVLRNNAEASTIFKRMKRGWQNESQCYNRAHVWAYEEFNRTQLKSMKLFLFFTNRYIRNYRYKWWFHVSPMAYVKEGSSTVSRVLDRRYTGGPRYVKTWTDNFIYSKRSCPVVNKYSDYRNNQQKEDCYLIPVSMYFWQPRDIDRYERTGQRKTSFIKSEVDWSYYEAF